MPSHFQETSHIEIKLGKFCPEEVLRGVAPSWVGPQAIPEHREGRGLRRAYSRCDPGAKDVGTKARRGRPLPVPPPPQSMFTDFVGSRFLGWGELRASLLTHTTQAKRTPFSWL